MVLELDSIRRKTDHVSTPAKAVGSIDDDPD